MDPASADVLDTLALAYFHTGNLNMAKRGIQSALEARPGDPSLKYHQAMIMEADGDHTGAREVLAQVLDSGQSFPERKEAEELFARL